MHISQSDIVNYEVKGFDGEKYIQLQSDAIRERIAKFPGKLYIEVWWKFLYDPHAARVLPWFDPESKKRIFQWLLHDAAIVFCVNARDIDGNRQLGSDGVSYEESVKILIDDIVTQLGIKPMIAINLVDKSHISDDVSKFRQECEEQWYVVAYRYLVTWYPEAVDDVVSEHGYGQDEYLETDKKLVLVTGAASNSGKMSTCLGQIYLDKQREIDSGYAKYETFPVWNLDLEHPINLAYEAATADIEDFNCVDFLHQDYYNQQVTNYNRDVEAFPIVMEVAQKIVGPDNYVRQYHSPTDMGINRAGFAITDDRICAEAALAEIKRRRDRYQDMVDRGEGEQVWVEDCERLVQQAEAYFI